MTRASVGICLALMCGTTGALMGQRMVSCGPRGSEKIESFSIEFPASMERTYSSALQAFITAGYLPNATTPLTNQVQWTSGEDENFFDGAIRSRFIRAVLYQTDSGTVVNVSAHETVIGNADVYTSNNLLTNRSRGYGYKVWCGAQTIADSLESYALTMRYAHASSRVDDDDDPWAYIWGSRAWAKRQKAMMKKNLAWRD